METATLEPTQTLPPRRRRFVFGKPAALLAALLIAALGFLGGVEVQKHDGGSSAAAASPAAAATGFRGAAGGFRGGFGGAAGGAGGAGGAAGGAPSDVTIGTVSSKNGRYLYVKDSNGTVVRVKATSTSTINRTAKAKTSAVHPGDTVVVQGAKSRSGTVTATRITATAAGSSAGGGGFPGGGPPGGFSGGGGGGQTAGG
jgi:hypothetical protein